MSIVEDDEEDYDLTEDFQFSEEDSTSVLAHLGRVNAFLEEEGVPDVDDYIHQDDDDGDMIVRELEIDISGN